MCYYFNFRYCIAQSTCAASRQVLRATTVSPITAKRAIVFAQGNGFSSFSSAGVFDSVPLHCFKTLNLVIHVSAFEGHHISYIGKTILHSCDLTVSTEGLRYSGYRKSPYPSEIVTCTVLQPEIN